MSLLIIFIVMYAALYDLRDCKIPNHSVVIILLIGVIQSLMTSFEVGSYHSVPIWSACLGLLVGLVICVILHLWGVFGAGDAKLLASLGTVVGFPDIFLLIAVSIFFVGLFGVFRLACYGELKDFLTRWKDAVFFRNYQPPNATSIAASGVPMGGAILLATMYCHFYLI